MTAPLTLSAPAKINLCLHVVGRRPDGYHRLDSVVAFASAGDRLAATHADAFTLDIEGPFGAGLQADGANLVVRAATVLAARIGRSPDAAMRLTKNLPIASGIGGGSADAAAALLLLAQLWRIPAALRAELPELALTLGADVPACLARQACRMQGIGEVLQPLRLPAFALLLVNPRMRVATASVFAARGRTEAAGSGTLATSDWPDVASLVGWLRETSNDLQTPAIELCPVIADVITTIAAMPGCLLARMSGSGATCFGIFADLAAAHAAAIGIDRPGWWIQAAESLA